MKQEAWGQCKLQVVERKPICNNMYFVEIIFNIFSFFRFCVNISLDIYLL